MEVENKKTQWNRDKEKTGNRLGNMRCEIGFVNLVALAKVISCSGRDKKSDFSVGAEKVETG